jgi:hypothetical protein
MSKYFFIIFGIGLFLLSIYIAIKILKTIYGEKISEWKPVIFDKPLTFRDLFTSNRKEKRNNQGSSKV